ncbi:MAG TPA: response regulator [Casimicrobiaceae bacterium]|nr:response regulator [Casimicrobiaceae bacterium]
MGNHRHVLVVEDDADSRMLLTALLTNMGYSVTSAGGGDEGLRFLYSETACDAVVADVMMPGMSGVEFARITREIRPGIPVALVTGRADGIDYAIDAGAIPLLKPFTPEQLEALWADAASANQEGRKRARSAPERYSPN